MASLCLFVLQLSSLFALRKHGLVSDFNLDSMEESYENGFVCKMCGMNFGEVIGDLQHHLIQKICQNTNQDKVIDGYGNFECENKI